MSNGKHGNGKQPRSSRKCLVCGHLYASHIDVCCIKVVTTSPRSECNCRGFVGSIIELQMAMGKAVKENNTQILTVYKQRLDIAIQSQ